MAAALTVALCVINLTKTIERPLVDCSIVHLFGSSYNAINGVFVRSGPEDARVTPVIFVVISLPLQSTEEHLSYIYI